MSAIKLNLFSNSCWRLDFIHLEVSFQKSPKTSTNSGLFSFIVFTTLTLLTKCSQLRFPSIELPPQLPHPMREKKEVHY